MSIFIESLISMLKSGKITPDTIQSYQIKKFITAAECTYILDEYKKENA